LRELSLQSLGDPLGDERGLPVLGDALQVSKDGRGGREGGREEVGVPERGEEEGYVSSR